MRGMPSRDSRKLAARTVLEVFKVFRRALKDYWGRLVLLWISISVGVAAGLITPIFYKQFFDTLSAGANASAVPALLRIVINVLLINMIGWVGWRSGTFLHNYVETKVMARLRENNFEYLMQHSYSFFAGSFSGALVQKVNRLVRAFEALLDSIDWNILPLILRIATIVGVIFVFSHALALILFVWMVSFMGINYAVSMWKMKYDTESAARESEVTGALADAITNHTNVQVFAALQRETDYFRGVSEHYRRALRLAWDMEAVLEAVQGFLAVLAEFLLVYFALKYWSRGLLTIGTFILLQTYLAQLINQLWDFGRMMRNVYRSIADAEEMVTILNTAHEVRDIPGAKPLEVREGRIEFRRVNFWFHPDRPVVDDLNLEIKPGEKVALIGPSGAGKSTLVKLLFRFYDVQRGGIFIDGQNIREITQTSLREQISLVPQEPILFHRTLFENIRYGKPDASPEEVYAAAELAHCTEFIDALPDKYDTYVGERGIKLSGGERQRIAIARAILKNAPILALDEATSSLDSRSEHLIQDALGALMKGKTVIVIAHRLSTIQKMDRIVVLENGRVREEGTHRELLNRPESLYAELWNLQAGGFLKGEAKEAESAEREVEHFYGEDEEVI